MSRDLVHSVIADDGRCTKLHHLNVGIVHKIMLIDEKQVTVTARKTGEVLALNHINDTRGYWENELLPPGRWPKI
jgi:hypothetical protein